MTKGFNMYTVCSTSLVTRSMDPPHHQSFLLDASRTTAGYFDY
jgi:hypothetical protein